MLYRVGIPICTRYVLHVTDFHSSFSQPKSKVSSLHCSTLFRQWLKAGLNRHSNLVIEARLLSSYEQGIFMPGRPPDHASTYGPFVHHWPVKRPPTTNRKAAKGNTNVLGADHFSTS